MTKIQLLSFTVALGFAPMAYSDIAGSIAIPSGGEAVQTNPPEDGPVKVVPRAEVKANRDAKKAANTSKDRMDTAQSCPAGSVIAANAAPGDPRCKTASPGTLRTKRPQDPPAQESQTPVNPMSGTTNIGGR